MSDQSPTAVTETTAPAVPTTQMIGVGDLADTVRVIDLAARRGAFEGAEILAVGTLRQKIVDFCNAYQAAQQKAVAAPESIQAVS